MCISDTWSTAVEIFEVVETGHQPIPAKNDPSDQESDVHLGSFLSALLDDDALIAHNPVMLAAKAAGLRQSELYAGAPDGTFDFEFESNSTATAVRSPMS